MIKLRNSWASSCLINMRIFSKKKKRTNAKHQNTKQHCHRITPHKEDTVVSISSIFLLFKFLQMKRKSEISVAKIGTLHRNVKRSSGLLFYLVVRRNRNKPQVPINKGRLSMHFTLPKNPNKK